MHTATLSDHIHTTDDHGDVRENERKLRAGVEFLVELGFDYSKRIIIITFH